MSVTLAKVKKLLTARESEFAASAAPKSLTGLSAGELRKKQKQAAKLHEKYADLAKRQRREARGKAAPRGKRPAQSNANTKLKAEYFEGVAQRIAQRLEKVDAQTSKPSRKRAGAAERGRVSGRGSARGKSGQKTAAKARKKVGSKAGKRSRSVTHGAFDEAHSVRRPASAIRSAGGAPAANGGSTGVLGLPPRLVESIEARKTRREQVDRESLAARKENIEAQRPDRRIEGHVRSSVRRRQAARDSGGGS